VRKLALLLIAFFYMLSCLAQDTVKKKGRLLPSVTEAYWVLKNTDSVKQGLYQAFFKRDIVLASGSYTNNKKSGTWHFYDTDGRLVENYDYNNLRLLYEERMDSATNRHIVYAFDAKYTDTDRLTRPVKPGGRCYGYIPFLQLFYLPENLDSINTTLYVGIVELVISPYGRLADIKIHIKSSFDEYITDYSPELVNEEDREFIPATINRQPIISRIFVRCRVTYDGRLDLAAD
jgi:hypothetical protein